MLWQLHCYIMKNILESSVNRVAITVTMSLHRVCTLLYQKENKLSKLVCTGILLFLLYEEVKIFVNKPTITTILKKALTGKDIPEMAVCLEPAFDIKKLQNYGYQGGCKTIKRKCNTLTLIIWILKIWKLIPKSF